MTFITAIELENFQSIEARTRIEFKPITLLYGPNSAGKSAVFDAIELLRVLLDPTALDEARAAQMIDRWARRGKEARREIFIAVEFPLDYETTSKLWSDPTNWTGVHKRTSYSGFHFDPADVEEYGLRIDDPSVRIEMKLQAIERRGTTRCLLIGTEVLLSGHPVLSLGRDYPGPRDLAVGNEDDSSSDLDESVNSHNDDSDDFDVTGLFNGWLEICYETGFLDLSIVVATERANETRLPADKKIEYLYKVGGLRRINSMVEVAISPLRIASAEERFKWMDFGDMICRNAEDIFFYLGTILWRPTRNKAPLVRADRRSPRPEEALTVVDLGLEGWWAKSSMSPSSPAALFKAQGKLVDEHFQGLAEAAHAALLLRAASGGYPWGDDHASKHVAPVRAKAEILDRVNHHLERSLFSEKLYRLECASTLMVPIDLDEEDPWTYYALAQPAAVRLYLREASGEKVDLQDVGSGVSYVLPVLYALSRQGLVQVQQPELHLHPALQASVGDIFIEELHRPGFGQLLIETHSEHILLRLLRRIRDTEKGRVLSDDVKLNNEQLAVYYFDPRPDGGTFVSRQLVTPLGDFYNDWPRGFFAERNKDLFDEE